MKNLDRRDDSVYSVTSRFKRLDSGDLAAIEASSGVVERKRSRICCHTGLPSSPQEMIISLRRGTYIRPHRHQNKAESGLCLRGEADAVFFDEDGEIIDAWRMGPEHTGLPFYYRIEEPVYHCLFVRSEVFVFHEVSTGPFRREDTQFAPWSPDEDNFNAVSDWLTNLKRVVDNYLATKA